MLELRPTCENCDVSLPPDATKAMICSFECTFCRDCVERVLKNCCPNCGGGFTQRPVRPSQNWVGNTSLQTFPASEQQTFKPVDPERQKALIERVSQVVPEKR